MGGVKGPGRHSRADAASSAGSLLDAAVSRLDRLAPVFALVVRWVLRAFSGRIAGAAVLIGLAAAWLDSSHLTPPLARMAQYVIVAAWLYVLLWLLVLAIPHILYMLREMLGYLILGLIVIVLPLRLVPAFRRWENRQFRGSKRHSPTPGA